MVEVGDYLVAQELLANLYMVMPAPVTEEPVVVMTAEQKTGRGMLAAALGFWMFVALCIDGLILAFGHTQSLAIICVRLGLTAALFYAVWIGQNWARWLTVVLFGIAALAAVGHLVVGQNVFVLVGALLFLGVFLMFTFVLLISRHVAAFLSYQQSRR